VQAVRESPARSGIAIASDFDNTIIFENSAKRLILFYLLHTHKTCFSARVAKVASIATRRLRRIHLRSYYDVVRAIPPGERRLLLGQLQLNPLWLQEVQVLRFRHRACDVHLTIISRNCVDVVSEWLALHHDELARRHIFVDGVIANKPLDDTKNEFVLELGDLHHFRHAGSGQLHLEGKARFASQYQVYLGDAAEEVLRDRVKEFIQV
jgi:hypothetical protein